MQNVVVYLFSDLFFTHCYLCYTVVVVFTVGSAKCQPNVHYADEITIGVWTKPFETEVV